MSDMERTRRGTYRNGKGRAFGSGANASDIAKFDLRIVSCRFTCFRSQNGLADAMISEGHTRMVIAG